MRSAITDVCMGRSRRLVRADYLEKMKFKIDRMSLTLIRTLIRLKIINMENITINVNASADGLDHIATRRRSISNTPRSTTRNAERTWNARRELLSNVAARIMIMAAVTAIRPLPILHLILVAVAAKDITGVGKNIDITMPRSKMSRPKLSNRQILD